MKKYLIVILLIIPIITACTNSKQSETIKNKFMMIKANSDNKVIINKNSITKNVTFLNYEVDGTIIQLIVAKSTDNKIKLAFNTCQSCNPSPNAYFIQKGEYLECQNCGSKFKIDEINVKKHGCNPLPVEEKEENKNQIIINKSYIEKYKTKFINWKGKIK